MFVSGRGLIGTSKSQGSIAFTVGLHAAAEKPAQIKIVSLQSAFIDLLSVFENGDTVILESDRDFGFSCPLADKVGGRSHESGTDNDAAPDQCSVKNPHQSFRHAR
ncbi:hypothetical protein F3P66_12155 [Agrobacterium fabrum]|uniref:Uncharacterized protein n=1 Tax=Agrobacterium fabrum (strain C58 / ATCC 33970) TaxID=176299 RepID=Q8UI37_AGRFC|nr:hypothetical protein Atu0463 [Agrobacterium fabrum str. C58]QRM60105.1 hypothetical protein F3P66_12155 [Agrobacterium fabrum]TRB31547.1 hypothetical protein EXN51_05300 [Agrobacterium fabrum]